MPFPTSSVLAPTPPSAWRGLQTSGDVIKNSFCRNQKQGGADRVVQSFIQYASMLHLNISACRTQFEFCETGWRNLFPVSKMTGDVGCLTSEEMLGEQPAAQAMAKQAATNAREARWTVKAA